MDGNTSDSDLLSTSEVLKTLGVSEVSLHRYIRAGRLRPCGALRFEGRSKLTNAFRREDVERVAKENDERKRGRPRKGAKVEEQDAPLPMFTLWTETFWPQEDGTWRVDGPMMTFTEEQYDTLERNRLAYFESRIAALVDSDLPDDAKADIVRELEKVKADAPRRKAEEMKGSEKFIREYKAAMKEIAAQKGTSRDGTATTDAADAGAVKRSRAPRRAAKAKPAQLLAEDKEEPP